MHRVILQMKMTKFTFIKLIILCYILLVSIQVLECTGTLWLKLVTYENPSNRLSNGNCCDGTSICQPCENYFRICLSSNKSSTPCSLGLLWTDDAADDSYTFGSTIYRSMPSFEILTNPLQYGFESWNNSLVINIDIFDNDHGITDYNHPSNDFVESLSTNLSQLALPSNSDVMWRSITLNGRPRGVKSGPKLVLQYRVHCNNNYLIPTCKEYCIDKNDASGHYKCDYTTGMRVCLPGWFGVDCKLEKIDCHPRNDPFGHYNCHENGTKLCLDGWTSPETNCTVAVKPQVSWKSLTKISKISLTKISNIATQTSTSRLILSSRAHSTPTSLGYSQTSIFSNIIPQTSTYKSKMASSEHATSSLTESLFTSAKPKSQVMASQALLSTGALTTEICSGTWGSPQLIATHTQQHSMKHVSKSISKSSTSSLMASSDVQQNTIVPPTGRPSKSQASKLHFLWFVLLIVPVAIGASLAVTFWYSRKRKRILRVKPSKGGLESCELSNVEILNSTNRISSQSKTNAPNRHSTVTRKERESVPYFTTHA